MVTIFHGTDLASSRQAFANHLSALRDSEILRLTQKEYDSDRLLVFFNSHSLFNLSKTLAFEGFFSLPKPSQDKLLKAISPDSTVNLVIWHDKALTAAQQKTFPTADIRHYKLDNQIYAALNAIRPGYLAVFIPLYRQLVSQNQYDIFLYLLKANLRRQLTGYTKFSPASVRQTYLQLITLDYHHKSGQLTIPKDIALERIILNLIK